MTLIVGVKCDDGCLVAADTAVTTGNAVYHGDKLHYYRGKGKKYILMIACAGSLTYARMASQQIRDEVAALENPTVASIKATIKATIADIYSRLIYPYWETLRPEASPGFSLIAGIVVEDNFDLVVSEDTAVEEVDTYAFAGSGTELAQYLGEAFLRSRGNSVLPFQTAAAVHLVVEILRVAKLYGASVGLDTQLIAWRTSTSYAPFFTPTFQATAQSDIGIIHENLKSALWDALDRAPSAHAMFEGKVANVVNLLRKIRGQTLQQGQNDIRFVRYWLSPESGEWSVADLDPNRGIPSLS